MSILRLWLQLMLLLSVGLCAGQAGDDKALGPPQGDRTKNGNVPNKNPRDEGNGDGNGDDGEKKAPEEQKKAAEEDPVKVHAKDDPFPDVLSTDDFDQNLSDGYHVVEFFSPYCSHCMHFKPKWERYYYDNHKQLEEQNKVFLRQVDCVASGELCDREGIAYYPQIRFYGPGAKLLGTMGTNYERDEEGLGNFCEDQVQLWGHAGFGSSEQMNMNDVKNSTLLSSKQLVKLLAGDGLENPTLISFWPSTDEELNNDNFQADHKESAFFRSASKCYSFRNLWNSVAKRLSAQIEKEKLALNFFNCGSNPQLCKSLDIQGFGHDLGAAQPRVMMLLPSSAGGNRIMYNTADPFLQQDLAPWTSRLLEIYKFEDKGKDDIIKKLEVKEEIKKNLGEVPDFSKVGFILLEDPDTRAPEDEMILKQALQTVMDVPGNVYLYRTTDKNNFIWMIKNQEKYLEETYANFDTTEDAPNRVHFSEEMFAARTLTTFPTLICLKSNSLTSMVYKSFSPKDVRDLDKVAQFIKENAHPTIRPLTAKSIDAVFPETFDPSFEDKTEKVLVGLMNLRKPKEMNAMAGSLQWIYNTYTYLKWRHQFEKLETARNRKYKEVAKLKAKDADYSDIMKTMSKKVPSVFDRMDDDLKVVFIDADKFSYFKKKLGWKNIRSSSMAAGDLLLLTRFGNSYWNSDLNGARMNMDKPQDAVNLIAAASFNQYRGSTLATPWFKVLVIIVVTVALLYYGGRFMNKVLRRRSLMSNKIKGLGILGVDPDLQTTELNKFE